MSDDTETLPMWLGIPLTLLAFVIFISLIVTLIQYARACRRLNQQRGKRW